MEDIVYHGFHDEFGSIPSTSILPVFVVQPNLTMFFLFKRFDTSSPQKSETSPNFPKKYWDVRKFAAGIQSPLVSRNHRVLNVIILESAWEADVMWPLKPPVLPEFQGNQVVHLKKQPAKCQSHGKGG